MTQHSHSPRQPKPSWLKVKIPTGAVYQHLKETAAQQGLATVCQEAQCPNIGECWSGGTATFMVMGDVCTRGCRFCAVKTGNPDGWLDADEPHKLAQTIQAAQWRYVVLTSVDRDDLPDGGAAHFAACIQAVRLANPEILIEVLIPDFQGDESALSTLVKAAPEVIAHNLETVERLTPMVRDRRATYAQSLEVLAKLKALQPQLLTKTSLMLGLGETESEIRQALSDLRQVNVDVITFGQYLQPSLKHLPVHAYLTPEMFDTWKQVAEQEFNFLYCASGPLVRSSYKAGELLMEALVTKQKMTIR